MGTGSPASGPTYRVGSCSRRPTTAGSIGVLEQRLSGGHTDLGGRRASFGIGIRLDHRSTPEPLAATPRDPNNALTRPSDGRSAARAGIDTVGGDHALLQ